MTLPAVYLLRVDVTGLSLTIAGQKLSGDFGFEKVRDTEHAEGRSRHAEATSTTQISVSNLNLRLGTAERAFVTVSNGQGQLTIATAGVYGRISASIAIDIPGVTLSGTFKVAFNTTGADQGTAPDLIKKGIKVEGSNVLLDVFGQRLTGGFTFEQDPTTRTLSIALRNVKLSLGNGTTTFVEVTISLARSSLRTRASRHRLLRRSSSRPSCTAVPGERPDLLQQRAGNAEPEHSTVAVPEQTFEVNASR